MTNEDVLDRFRTFRAVKLQPVLSYRYERRHFRSDEHVIKGGKSRASNSRRLWGGQFHFCSSPGQKLGCYGLGRTSATIVAHFLRVQVQYSTTFQYECRFREHLRTYTGRVAGGMENRPKIKYSQSTNGFRNRLGQLENVPKLVSEWSGDGRKVEKI